MRQKCQSQLPLTVLGSDHPWAKILEEISRIIDENPSLVELVWQDLTAGKTDTGAHGMTAGQVLRMAMLYSLEGFCYEELSFHLNETPLYRSFCRLEYGKKLPSRSAIAGAVKCIGSETWAEMMRVVARYASDEGVEKGRKVRADCTVVESNIHSPWDSDLLKDCVMMLIRLLERSGFGAWHDRTLSTKRRTGEIRQAKGWKERRRLYRSLLKITSEVMGYAESALVAIRNGDIKCPVKVAGQLPHYIDLTGRVIDQTRRRVLDGEKVPSSEKVVSIHEDHTDLIRKDNRETHYGHKICLTAGESGLVSDCVILKGNPSDSSLTVKVIDRQEEIYGRPPLKVAFDGGFASQTNLSKIKSRKVKDVCFSKRRGMKKTDMCRSDWVYRKLWRFRAGVESIVSWLKRCFGLTRCIWRSFDSFRSYVLSRILAANLLTIARART